MIQFTITALVFLGFESILVLGLNIQFGLTGILNLAYIVFYAMGAYVAGVLAGPAPTPPAVTYIGGYGLPFYVGLLGAMVAGGVLAALVGAFALGRRLRSSYLAVTTLVVSVVLLQVTSQDQGIFNGSLGLLNIPAPFGRGLSSNSFNLLYLIVLVVVVVICFVICEHLRRSPFGRVLRLIREDDVAAQVFGYDIFRFKLKAYVFGGVLSALAGAFTMYYIGSFGPGGWAIGETLFALTCVLVGGAGNTWGVIIGAAIIELGFVQATSLLPTVQSDPELISILRGIAVPLLLLITLRFRPQGILPERLPKFGRSEGESTQTTGGPLLVPEEGAK